MIERGVSDWMKSPVLDGVVLRWCLLISLSTLLWLSPGFTSAPGFSVSPIDSENHELITPYTEDWLGTRHQAKMLLSLWLMLSTLTDWMTDRLNDRLRNRVRSAVRQAELLLNILRRWTVQHWMKILGYIHESLLSVQKQQAEKQCFTLVSGWKVQPSHLRPHPEPLMGVVK